MDEWEVLKNKPRIKDIHRFKDGVMSQINIDDATIKKQSKLFWKIAASILVLFSVGSYTWMETDTYLSRETYLANVTYEESSFADNTKCQYQVANLINVMTEAGLIIDVHNRIVQFSIVDVQKIIQTKSSLSTDIEQFIQAMQKLYPLKFQQYKSGEVVELNIWQLRENQQLCDWIK
nr:hypothetical protein [uncultured Carboxylicivirga sp.]